jgi:2,3-bisphosphoglycerate-independent phosphoglycerate mutase
MIDNTDLRECVTKTDSKIILLVADGLGGAPHPKTRKSELETAHLPNLNALAGQSACGLSIPVAPGIAPGSGPGHLALFGYDPLKYIIGRGALEAFGVDGVDFKVGDVAARGNFSTVDADGKLLDRRAGRILSEQSVPLCHELDKIKVDGVESRVYPVKDYRFVLRLRGPGLSDALTETDPQRLGVEPLPVKAKSSEAEKTARVANEFIRKARQVLMEEKQANMVMLRGFSGMPDLPSFGEAFKLNPAAIAAYPMYRGLAAIVGMNVLRTGGDFDAEVKTLHARYKEHDFFFIHYKYADAAGEDGNFDGKVEALEVLDKYIPSLLELKPDVFMLAGDHSTPAILAAHSWHPVPFLLHSRLTLGEGVEAFHEKACARGSLGILPATGIMPLALAHAGKLAKFGA